MHSINPNSLSRGVLAAAFALLACVSVRAGTLYLARLSSANENPPNPATFTGTGVLILNDAETVGTVTATHNITLPITGGHIHRGTATVNGPVIFPFAAPTSPVGPLTWNIPVADVDNLKNGGLYMNFHTAVNPGGVIRDTLRRAMLGPAAMTPVQTRLANALDLSAGYNSDLDSILVATNLANTATQTWTLDQLRGGTIHALGRQGVETMVSFETTVFAHTDDIRANPVEGGDRFNGFIRVGNEFGDRSMSENQLGSSISRPFALLGLDMQFGPSTRAGLALGLADGEDEFDDGAGSTTVKTTALQGYLSFGFGDTGLIFDATGGYGSTSGDTTRNLTSLMRTATGSADGEVWSGALRLSKALGGAGRVTFVPYAFIDVQKASVDGYTETGAAAANLVVSDHEQWSSAFEAGTSLLIPLQAGGGGMSFRLQAGWHYLVEEGAGSTSTWLVGSPIGFTTEFDGQPKSTARVAATFEYALNNGMLITAGYRGLLGSDALHAVEAGLAFRF
jgi:uncharacterized protein with beta-barrel porin domain